MTATTTATPTQLRRRCTASHRLPVLDCGWADPWSATPWPPYNVEASRKAWDHLNVAGLLSEVVVRVLDGAA